ncbi:MAG: sulfatase [Verrucomicrobiota bacterium]
MKSLLCALLALFIFTGLASADDKPNVLWIYLEDVSGWFSCYGDDVIETPNLDALAASGIRFDRFYTPAGVCSATRSGVITGMMQTSIGAHHHRSCRSEFRGMDLSAEFDENILPEAVVPLPILFRENGYYTFNEGGGKDDFNFTWSHEEFYDHWQPALGFKGAVEGSEWTGRAEGQPFFGQIQLRGGKSGKAAEQTVDRSAVPVPPYYPDIPEVREEIAHHYDCLLLTDRLVGEIVDALKRDGLYENTYIFLLSDHGYKLHRHKQFLYEGGIHMPGFIAGPGIEPNQVRDDLVSAIDFAPTSLAVAGLPIPEVMEGRDVLADNYTEREFVIAARDRCDYTIEHIRAVVTPRFKYLRNYMPELPFMQESYKDGWAVSKRFREMMAAGEMNETQLIFFGPDKAPEELYDLEKDPHEIYNLADDPHYAEILDRHRAILESWIEESGDQGVEPESDIGLLSALRRWKDKCVHPAYDRVRDRYEAQPLP